MNLVLLVTAAISVFLNFTLLALYFRAKKQKHKRSDSRELQEFMLDLMQGDGLIRITRVNPSDIFLRSPRDAR